MKKYQLVILLVVFLFIALGKPLYGPFFASLTEKEEVNQKPEPEKEEVAPEVKKPAKPKPAPKPKVVEKTEPAPETPDRLSAS